MKKRLLATILTLCLTAGAALSSVADGTVHAAEAGKHMGVVLSSEPAEEPEDFSVKTTSPFNGQEYKHAADKKDNRIRNGVCVSEWLGAVDWEKAKEAGVEFAFIRCGYTAISERFTMQTDKNFRDNIVNASRAGIKVGAYYSSNAVTLDEAEQEAAKTLELIGDYRHILSLPVVYNCEMLSGSDRTAKMDMQRKTEYALKYMQTIKNAGYTAMYNGTPSFLRDSYDTELLAEYGCWLIDESSQTAYTGDYVYWQYASTNEVKGLSGKADCMFYYEPSAVSNESEKTEKPKAQKITYQTRNMKNGRVQYGAKFSLGAKASGKGKLSYKSSNNKVLSVDSRGKVSAKGYGSAVITIKAAKTEGYQAASRTVKLKVVPAKVTFIKAEWRYNKELKKKMAYYEWKEVPSVSDYQYCLSYRKDFKESTSGTVTKTNVGLHSFPAKDRIYLRVRARKITGSKKYYGDWSTAWELRL